jgi:hypothetical protein
MHLQHGNVLLIILNSRRSALTQIDSLVSFEHTMPLCVNQLSFKFRLVLNQSNLPFFSQLNDVVNLYGE